MQNALVSVIIPVLNGQRFIGRTLDSVLSQTYRALEVVIVDDGSTDQTATIIAAAAARDSRLRFFRKPHSGLSATRNFGIARANGSLIAPLDADDLWHPTKIALQVDVMQSSSPKVGVVYCWSVDIDENDFVIPPIEDKCIAQGHVVAELAAKNNFLENASVPLIRRFYLDAVGGYDLSLVRGSEDWKLNLALAEICDFAVVATHLVGYRRSSTNMSKNTAAMERSIDHVQQWIMEKWPDLPATVKRQMFYHSNSYLAHQALTANNFTKAVRYKLRSLKAEPAALFTPPSVMFAVRLLARLLRVNRTSMCFRGLPISFRDFEPKPQ